MGGEAVLEGGGDRLGRRRDGSRGCDAADWGGGGFLRHAIFSRRWSTTR